MEHLNKVHVFSLVDHQYGEDITVMTTSIDECDPRVDDEFWKMFLTGAYVMRYDGSYDEVVHDE